ncbi:hypothetical protein MAR_005108 [Mya arenaria]|uniref:TNFR-Cys domain-containing protein n=1 Tax=Mya arenaria TaxID=6604 RepID=A0ABY7EYJ3_MYAAR|nr:hypothetical protein MAR_005108 [Mya arenaria]
MPSKALSEAKQLRVHSGYDTCHPRHLVTQNKSVCTLVSTYGTNGSNLREKIYCVREPSHMPPKALSDAKQAGESLQLDLCHPENNSANACCVYPSNITCPVNYHQDDDSNNSCNGVQPTTTAVPTTNITEGSNLNDNDTASTATHLNTTTTQVPGPFYCIQCASGEYYDKNNLKCKTCSTHCLECIDEMKCTKCYVKHDKDCYHECPEGYSPSVKNSEVIKWESKPHKETKINKIFLEGDSKTHFQLQMFGFKLWDNMSHIDANLYGFTCRTNSIEQANFCITEDLSIVDRAECRSESVQLFERFFNSFIFVVLATDDPDDDISSRFIFQLKSQILSLRLSLSSFVILGPGGVGCDSDSGGKTKETPHGLNQNINTNLEQTKESGKKTHIEATYLDVEIPKSTKPKSDNEKQDIKPEEKMKDTDGDDSTNLAQIPKSITEKNEN